MRGFDRVDEHGTGPGQRHDLGLGRLCLEQKRRLIEGVRRIARRTQDLSSQDLHDGGCVGFQRMSERIVGGQEYQLVPPDFISTMPVPRASE